MAKKHTGAKVGIGLALAAASAAAAYFLSGKKGAKNRAAVAKWTAGAKKEVLAGMKRMKAVDQKTYVDLVRTVSARYKKAKGIDPKEVAALERELKSHWGSIKKQVATAAKKVKSSAKKRK